MLVPSHWKLWRVAVRPFAYPASIMPVLVGAALARQAGHPLDAAGLALALLGVVSFHTGGNLLNDASDHRKGLDRVPGPNSGAVVRGWITEGQAFRAGAGCLAAGLACALLLGWREGWDVLIPGAAGALLALLYTTPRFSLKYIGGGDLAVFLAFGVLAVWGSYRVQAGRFDVFPLLWSLPFALLSTAILHANNWRDLDTDRARGCVTVAGRLGPARSCAYYRLLVLSPFVLVALNVLIGRISTVALPAPAALLAAFLALPLAWPLARVEPGDREALGQLDARTARLHLAFSALCGIAFWFG